MKPSKVLQFAHAQVAQAWKRFQLLAPVPSMDPNSPPVYLVKAQGERGDGTVFEVHVAIDKVRFDLLQGAQALHVAVDMTNKALQQLQTYTGCDCKEGQPCEQHKQVVH